MASLPARQTSQRRQSPEQQSQPPSQPHTNTSPSPVRTRSEDSQTLFLNKPSTEDDSTSQQQEDQASPPLASPNQDEASIKRCWICFSDSTEDTPETSPWRNPCPCALVAHEECLLDWIADMESPTNNRRNRGATSLSAPSIQCPQCKSEIKLARPRNFVVEGVRGLERLGSQLVTPGALTVLFGTVYHSSMAWGVHSVYAIFGAEDGFRILRPLILNTVRPPLEFRNQAPLNIGETMMAVAVNHLQHWRLYVGLPLITPMLVLSRTTLADSVLPVLPILFFATQTHASDDGLDFGTWPPSASLAFAVLPYVRSAYNMFYHKMFAGKEKQWLKEIQPRVTQQAAQEAAAGNAEEGNEQGGVNGMGPREDDDNVFEVRIDGGIWEDWEEEDSDDEDAHNPPQQQPNNVPAQPPQQQQDGQGQQDQNNGQPQDQQQEPQPNNQPAGAQPANQPAAAGGAERRLSFSPTAIAETVLGALVFPALAGISGEVLKLALPRSWTTPPSAGLRGASGRIATKGLLQEKWGRSLVGGCLFVVLKDAVMLYVRWKMAQMHRRRRVLDYGGKKVGAAAAA